MAHVVVGGLLSSTLPDLPIPPGIFRLFGRQPPEAHVARPSTADPAADAADAAAWRLASELEALTLSENPA